MTDATAPGPETDGERAYVETNEHDPAEGPDGTGAELIVHPATAEAIAVKTEATDELASRVLEAAELRAQLADFEATIGDELLDRMDKALTWTHRVGDPRGDRQLELKAASPTAGTTSYREDVLEAELRKLIDAGVLDASALDDCTPLEITIKASGRNEVTRLLLQRARTCRESALEHGHPAIKIDQVTKVQQAGIKKLEKLGDDRVDAAIAKARERKPVGARKVAIKPITKAAR